MPNRIIKESICTSDTLDQLSVEEERFFYRLLVQADDFGRFDGRAPVVLAGCFPLRAHEISIDNVEGWLQALADVDLIRFYHIDGRRYLQFTTWDRHQQKRAKHSKFPDPPADDLHLISDDIRRESSDSKCPRESRSEKREYEKSRSETHAREDAIALDVDDSESPATPAAPAPSDVSEDIQPSEATPDPINDDAVTPEAYYEQRTAAVCVPSLSALFGHYEEVGLQPSAIKWAIQEQALSGKSGQSYLRSILERLKRDGLFTAEAAERNQEAHYEPTRMGPPSRAQPQPVGPVNGAGQSVPDEMVERWKALYPDEYDEEDAS